MKVCQFQRVSLSSDQRANKFMIKANFWFNLNSWDPLICCTAGTRFIQLLAGFPFNRTDNIGDDIFVLLMTILAVIYLCFWWQYWRWYICASGGNIGDDIFLLLMTTLPQECIHRLTKAETHVMTSPRKSIVHLVIIIMTVIIKSFVHIFGL